MAISPPDMGLIPNIIIQIKCVSLIIIIIIIKYMNAYSYETSHEAINLIHKLPKNMASMMKKKKGNRKDRKRYIINLK